MTLNCGRCHNCGQPVRIALDGEEWCGNCQTYQRPASHGWCRCHGDHSLCWVTCEIGAACTECGFEVVQRFAIPPGQPLFIHPDSGHPGQLLAPDGILAGEFAEMWEMVFEPHLAWHMAAGYKLRRDKPAVRVREPRIGVAL